MGYLIQSECEKRIENLRALMDAKNVDVALVYYDEFNIGNGWYLTGWCPQFESGAVLVFLFGIRQHLGEPAAAGIRRQVGLFDGFHV